MKKLELTAEDIIKNTKHWNDGHGLIVHPQMGRLLKSIGIKEGYTVYKQIPKGSKVLSEILK